MSIRSRAYRERRERNPQAPGHDDRYDSRPERSTARAQRDARYAKRQSREVRCREPGSLSEPAHQRPSYLTTKGTPAAAGAGTAEAPPACSASYRLAPRGGHRALRRLMAVGNQSWLRGLKGVMNRGGVLPPECVGGERRSRIDLGERAPWGVVRAITGLSRRGAARRLTDHALGVL
jgi:hypothetical protein